MSFNQDPEYAVKPNVKRIDSSKLRNYGLTTYQLMIKRSIDLLISFILILLLLPLIMIISVVIKFDSKGPIFFKQKRVGYLGCLFVCYKFRSMYYELQDLSCISQVTKEDARVTSVGRWLRRLSLDELPQLFNVVRGDMSLVGPRPHAHDTKAGNIFFHQALENYSDRHYVLPGITGLAQVSGCRGRTSTVKDLERRVELDLNYINQWSPLLNLKILAATAFHLFGNEIY